MPDAGNEADPPELFPIRLFPSVLNVPDTSGKSIKAELAATNPGMRLTEELHGALSVWGATWYRDRLTPADLADPQLLVESRGALDELTQILGLGGGFYPFQRG